MKWKTMEEYEYLNADSADNFAEIAKWVLSGEAYEKSYVDDTYSNHPSGWIHKGRTYRRKIYVLLNDPEEIVRGIDSCVIEFNDDSVFWHLASKHHAENIGHYIKNGVKYRVKTGCTLPPKKIKKLVDRTAEELIPLIGYIARKKRDGLYFMITSNQVFDQENMEIASFGSEEWQPMQKEIEVEG